MTIHMLEYLMSFCRPVGLTSLEHLNTELRAIRLWQPGHLRKDILYLITPEQWKSADNLTPDIILCCPYAVSFPTTYCCLYSKETVDTALFFNEIQEQFLRFEDWLDDIDDTLSQNLNLNTLFRNSSHYLHMDLNLADDNFQFLASSTEATTSANPKSMPRISLEIINSLILEEEYAHIKEHRDVFIYPSRNPDITNQYYNIFVHDQYFARLLSQPASNRNLIGAGQLLRCLGEKLAEYYRQQTENQFQDTEKNFKEMISLILQNRNIDQTILEQSLLTHGWKTHHRYWVMCFEFFNEISHSYYCSQLELLFHNSAALSIENNILCICNLSLTSEEEILTQLPLFLRESLCKSGISSYCTDFFRLYHYRLEAEAALRLGKVKQETFWYYRFNDFILPYIVEMASDKLPLYNLCHPALHILKEYDQENEAFLTDTLYRYLNNMCNASLTANELFIHRTTMFYRLRKIEELTKLQLKDPNVRLHLELSFYMMRSADS